jgi:hypothetical protein
MRLSRTVPILPGETHEMGESEAILFAGQGAIMVVIGDVHTR